MKAQFNTKDRSKLFPSTTDDLLRRLSHPSRNDHVNTLPIPLPKKEVKGGVSRKTWDEIEQAQFAAGRRWNRIRRRVGFCFLMSRISRIR